MSNQLARFTICLFAGHRWHVCVCLCCAFCLRCHITDEQTSLGRALAEAKERPHKFTAATILTTRTVTVSGPPIEGHKP